MNAYEVRQAWCLLQVKLCDPCLSALNCFVYHARRYTSARHLPLPLLITMVVIMMLECLNVEVKSCGESLMNSADYLKCLKVVTPLTT